MSAIYVEITATKGSAPRDTGTVMKVTMAKSTGTIGGGALEFKAIQLAREMLASGTNDRIQSFALGPGLGQCCGGSVTLLFTRQARALDAPPTPLPLPTSHAPQPLWVWGAGHVGRAVIDACPPHAFTLTWVDDAPDRFPAQTKTHVKRIPATDMPLLAARAPRDAHHLIFTYSHDIDFALCVALLKRGAVSIGLIGSATKRARFFKRLRALGLDPTPIICPIGDKAQGKHPSAIAHSTLTALLAQPQLKASA